MRGNGRRWYHQFSDVLTDDPAWAAWSMRALDEASLRGPLVINNLINAELSIRIDTIEQLDAILDQAGLTMLPIPRSALFLAGKVVRKYRAAGRTRSGVLPDVFIGAHAAVSGMTLLSRDGRRYRFYFPRLILVAP